MKTFAKIIIEQRFADVQPVQRPLSRAQRWCLSVGCALPFGPLLLCLLAACSAPDAVFAAAFWALQALGVVFLGLLWQSFYGGGAK